MKTPDKRSLNGFEYHACKGVGIYMFSQKNVIHADGIVDCMDFKLGMNARYFGDKELLNDLKRAAELLGKQTIGHGECERVGQFLRTGKIHEPADG